MRPDWRPCYRDKAAAQSSWNRNLPEAVFEGDREGICQTLADGETARPHCRFRRIQKAVGGEAPIIAMRANAFE